MTVGKAAKTVEITIQLVNLAQVCFQISTQRLRTEEDYSMLIEKRNQVLELMINSNALEETVRRSNKRTKVVVNVKRER